MSSTPALEGTNYPSLTGGHPSASCTDVSIVGLHVQVYGLKEIAGSNLPIAAVIATHGRCNKKEQMSYFAHGLIGAASDAARGHARKRDLIVVTMDQRNHGSRLKDKKANLAYDENERHLYDMAACVVGGCHDVALVMDFLAAYLFPSGERVIEEFIPTGISLGGNLTWRLLREDPRITIGIPLIGLPFSSFGPYLRARAESMGLKWEPPLVPPSILPFIEVPVEAERYAGKKILSIHGAVDELVPIRRGQQDLDAIRAVVGNENMEVLVVDGVGHKITPEMVKRTGQWVWRWALSTQGSAQSKY